MFRSRAFLNPPGISRGPPPPEPPEEEPTPGSAYMILEMSDLLVFGFGFGLAKKNNLNLANVQKHRAGHNAALI